MKRIELEISLEQHTLSNGRNEVEEIWLTVCIGRGEYVVGRGRLFVMGYKTTERCDSKNSVTPVSKITLGFEKDTQTVIPLDAYGIGRMFIPPDQYLIVRDKAVPENQILPS